MSIVVWIVIAISIVLAAAPVTGGRRRGVHEKNLAKLTRKSGLPLPPSLRGAVLARVSSREHTAVAWGFGGIAAGTVVAIITARATGFDGLNALLVLLAAAMGTTVGSYRDVLQSPRHLFPNAPRVARSHSTSLDDYTTEEERRAVKLVPVSVLLALVTSVTVWTLTPVKPAGGSPVVPLALAAGAVAVIGAWHLLRRAASTIVDHPQRAHDDLELAWDDALRVGAIRDVQDAAISTGMLATFGMLAMAGNWVITPEARAGAEELTFMLGMSAFAVGLVCWGLLLIPWIDGRSQGNPSLRLWHPHRSQEA